jgi:hypothetical protein
MKSRYKRIKLPDGSTRDEHRLVMEKFLFRKLSRYEVVHHINEDRFDNRIENLEVMTLAEHTSLHNQGRPKNIEAAEKSSATQRGKRRANSVLSDKTVREIKNLRADGNGPTAIAKMYAIHKSTVIDIVKGRRYNHVPSDQLPKVNDFAV